MKRLLVLATLIIVIVIVFCFCKWALAPSEVPATAEHAQQTAPAPPDRLEQAPASRPTPGVVNARPVPAQPITDAYKRIFDSPDVMGTIDRVRASGTADEKEWALQLLIACVQVNAQASRQRADADNREQDASAGPPTTAALAALKKQASEARAARCSGVKSLTLEDRQSLEADLRAAAVANQSMLRQLEVLSSSQESRWSTEQAEQITNALYSGDPVRSRAAFFVLWGAMDRDSPGGQDRNAARQEALGPIYVAGPQSDFDRLGMCANLGRCGSAWDTDYPAPPPNAEVARLADKYRAAVESRMDAGSIMAIR